MPEVVIIGEDGREHVFPDGFDPKRAAAIVRAQAPEPTAHIGPGKPELTSDPLGYGMELMSNIPGSVGNLVVDTIKGIPTAIATAAKVAYEASPGSSIPKALDVPHKYTVKPSEMLENLEHVAPTGVSVVRGLLQHYKDRFGSPATAAATFRDDPAGAIADVLPLGKPLQMAGTAGKARAVRVARQGAERAVSNLPNVEQVLSNRARKRLVSAVTTNRVAASKLHKASSVAEEVGSAMDKPIEAAAKVVTPLITKPSKVVKELGTSAMVRAAKPAVNDMRDMPSGRQNVSQARRDFVNTLAHNNAGLNADGLDKIRKATDEHNTTIDDVVKGNGEIYLDADRVGRLGRRVGGMPDISLGSVERELDALKDQFSKQVNPTADLEAIERVRQDFRKRVGFTGGNPDEFPIPFDLAHELKKGTNLQLRGKFGELKSAEVEAQKALTRGLKNEVAGIEPTIEFSNRKLSELYPAERALERIVNRLEASQPFGLREVAGIGGFATIPAAMTGNPAALLGLAGAGLWQLSRPEVLFPIGRTAYKAGRRGTEINPANVERALRIALYARTLGVSEEEAEAILDQESDSQTERPTR